MSFSPIRNFTSETPEFEISLAQFMQGGAVMYMVAPCTAERSTYSKALASAWIEGQPS